MTTTVITPYDDVSWKRFKAGNETETFMWAFGRSAKSSAWFLRDHDGYIRTLAGTWVDSAPMIQAVVDSYGLISQIN